MVQTETNGKRVEMEVEEMSAWQVMSRKGCPIHAVVAAFAETAQLEASAAVEVDRVAFGPIFPISCRSGRR